MKDFLEKLLASLNQVEVKGKANMDILLGCMFAIEKKIDTLKEESVVTVEETDDGR